VELMSQEQPHGDALAALHPEERSLLDSVSPPLRREAFYRCFVRKEAYLKGLGLGLAVEPGEVFVGFGAAPELRDWTVRDLNVGAGHAAAVALETNCEPSVRHRRLRYCQR
jgi:4'-phosphopantetheinyl transferase